MAIKLRVEGKVQGVGFRATMKRLAKRYSLNGYAKNKRDGSVEIVLDGSDDSISDVRKHLRNSPGFSKVDRVQELETIEDTFENFETY